MRARPLVLLALGLVTVLAGCAAPGAPVEPASAEAGAAPTLPIVLANETMISWVKAANVGVVDFQRDPIFPFDVPAAAKPSRIEVLLEWDSHTTDLAILDAFVLSDQVVYAEATGSSPLTLVVDDPDVARGGRWAVVAWPGDEAVTANPQRTALKATITIT